MEAVHHKSLKMRIQTVILSFGISLVTGQQTPQLCANQSTYQDCQLKARNAIAQCSSNVVNVPDAAFYDCQCKALSSGIQCYWYCQDDPQLQMQLPVDQANANAACSYANQMSALPLSSTTTAQKTTSTATLAPPKTTVASVGMPSEGLGPQITGVSTVGSGQRPTQTLQTVQTKSSGTKPNATLNIGGASAAISLNSIFAREASFVIFFLSVYMCL